LKQCIKPWLKEQWCIPEKESAEFVCAMEDVLDVYHLPPDPKRPLVCFDEASKPNPALWPNMIMSMNVMAPVIFSSFLPPIWRGVI